MAEEQSQVKPPKLYHSNLRRTALLEATRCDLSRVELQVLQNMIEWVPFHEGKVDFTKEISEPIKTYMKNLAIKDKAPISRAFSRLEELGLIQKRRVGNVMHRSFTTYFIQQCSQYGVDQPINRQSNGCTTDQPPIDGLVNRQLRPGSTLPLDRRVDERKDERMDGIKSPPTGGKFDFVTYSQKIESLFRPSAKYVPYGEVNVLVLELYNEGGSEELNMFCDYLRLGLGRLRNRGINLPFFSVKELRGLMGGWRDSEERKAWQNSLEPQNASLGDEFESQAISHC